MFNNKLKDAMTEKYGLTNMEVDDVMRYMTALTKEYAQLAGRYKTEHLVTLKSHAAKASKAKAEKDVFSKMAKVTLNRLGGQAKELLRQYKATHSAYDVFIEALAAHKIEGNHRRTITDILALMSEHNELRKEDQTVTGRRAFETLQEAGIGA